VALQDALAFLRRARFDESVGRALEELHGEATWSSLVDVATRAGFRVTAEELERAFALDWGLRWARYGGTVLQEAHTGFEPVPPP
jgi:hypothetical protein